MKNTYTTSEVRMRLSELLKQVRDGETITITHRGEPVAELRPIPKKSKPTEPKKPQTVEERLDEMSRSGILGPAYFPGMPFKPGPHRIPGALERFLKER